jgi:hypothetical protein
MDLGEAVLTLRVDIAELSEKMDEAKEKTSQFADTAKLAAGGLALLAASKKVVDFLKDCVTEFTAAEASATLLAGAVKSTGDVMGTSVERMLDLASALQKTTKYSDEASQGAMSLLMTIGGLTSKMAMDTLPAVQDLAAGLGIDLETAANMVSKTMEGNTGALGRYGIKIEAGLKGTEAMTAVTKALEERFGGLAQAIGDTASAKLVQLQNAFSDVKEEIGRAIVTAIKPFVAWLTEVVSGIGGALKAANDLKDALRAQIGGWADTNDKLTIAKARYNDARKALEDYKTAIENEAYSTSGATLADETYQAAVKKKIAVLQGAINTARLAMDAATNLSNAEQAAADAEAEHAKAVEQYQDLVKTAYEKTDAGKAASLKADIAYWEASLRVDKTNAAEITAILTDLRAQYEKLGFGVADLGYLVGWEAEHMADTWVDVSQKIVTTTESTFDEAYDRIALFGRLATDDTKKIADTWEETFSKIANTGSSVLEGLSGIFGTFYEGRMNEIDVWYQKELAALGDMTDATQDQLDAKAVLDADYAKKQKEIRKKEWESSQALAIGNATIAGIESVMKTLAAYPWPWNLIPAGIMTALAAVQVGLIASMPEPAFSTGADFTVPPGYDNDSYPMRVESGEHVTVTPAGGGGGDLFHVVVNLNEQPILDCVTRGSRNKKVLITARSVVP